MPIDNAKYRYKEGTNIRLAYVDGKVVEAKNMDSGATHTPKEFKADAKRKKKHTTLRSLTRK